MNLFAKESAAGFDPNSAAMTMKMKGLLKGLRYISQIFDEEEEPELQIGNPTDVKHVAHIGWDGPTANAPSWINQFKGEGDAAGAGATGGGDADGGKANNESTTETSSKRKSEKAKGSRRKGSTESSSTESPNKSLSTSEGKTKQPGHEPPASAQKDKSSRKKKSKAASASGTSSKSSKSKNTTQSIDVLPDSAKAPSSLKASKNKETSPS